MLPPLRKRGEDVLLLSNHFLSRFNEEKGASITGMSEEVKRTMLNYQWPGNVRELQNLIERVTTLKRVGIIELEDLPSRMISDRDRVLQSFQMDMDNAEGIDLKSTVDEFESHLILSALQRFNWNKNQAANFLAMNRTTLVEKIKKKGLQPTE